MTKKQPSQVIKTLFTIGVLALVSKQALAIDAQVTNFMPGALSQMTINTTAATTTAVTGPLTTVISDTMTGLKSMLIQAQQNIATQQQQAQAATNSALNSIQIDQSLQPASDACATAVVSNAASAASKTLKYNANIIGYSGAYRAGNAPTKADQKRIIVNQHVSTYCDPATDPAQCAASGEKPAQTNGASSSPEGMVGSDQRASTLFSGAGAPGHVANLTYTPQQKQAAMDYINNTIDGGNSPRKLSQAEFLTPQGQQYEGLRIAYEAKMSMSRDALAYIAASRLPVPGSSSVLTDIANSDAQNGNPGTAAAYIQNRLNDPVNGILKYSPSGDVSPMELLSIEVGRRIDNPNWILAINSQTNSVALQREQTMMLAMMMKMQYMLLQQNEMKLGMQAVTSAEATKKAMDAQISQADLGTMQGLSSH